MGYFLFNLHYSGETVSAQYVVRLRPMITPVLTARVTLKYFIIQTVVIFHCHNDGGTLG
jgi:hypothetical protein